MLVMLAVLFLAAVVSMAGYLLWMLANEKDLPNPLAVPIEIPAIPVRTEAPAPATPRREAARTAVGSGDRAPSTGTGSGCYGLKGRHSSGTRAPDERERASKASPAVPWSSSRSPLTDRNEISQSARQRQLQKNGLFHNFNSFEHQSSGEGEELENRYTPNTPLAEKNCPGGRGSSGSGSKPVAVAPPIEFTEVSVLDSDAMPHIISPSRFTAVFSVLAGSKHPSYDASSPLKESAASGASLDGDGDGEVDGTRYERDRQAALMKRILDKQSSFENSQKQNLHAQKQTSATDKNLLEISRRSESAKKAEPPPPAPSAAPSAPRHKAGHESAFSPGALPATVPATSFKQTSSVQEALKQETQTDNKIPAAAAAAAAVRPAPPPAAATAPPSPFFDQLSTISNAQEYIHHKKTAVLESAHSSLYSQSVTSALSGVQPSMQTQVRDSLERVTAMRARSGAESTVEEAVEVGSAIEVILQQSRKVSLELANSLRYIFAESILDAAHSRGTEDGAVLMLSHLLLCLCKDSKPGGEMIANALLRRSALCWPSLCAVDMGTGREDEATRTPAASLEGHSRYVTIFATLVASTEYSSVFRKDEGWTWLVRMGKNLHRAVKILSLQQQQGGGKGEMSPAVLAGVRMGCGAAHKLLRICGRALLLDVGPQPMEGVLRGLRQVCLSFNSLTATAAASAVEVGKLLALTEVMIAGGKSEPLSLKSQPPYVIAARAYASALKKLRESADVIDKDKSEEMKATKTKIGIRSLPMAFNMISTMQTGQDNAINSLITKINEASSLNDRELLRYTIYKITTAAMGVCQTEHFSLKDGLPLVRVVCNLCHLGGASISAIFKMQFVSLCPLSIPNISEKATGDAFSINMGFLTRMGANNEVIYKIFGCCILSFK
jgi:hypothetical protein